MRNVLWVMIVSLTASTSVCLAGGRHDESTKTEKSAVPSSILAAFNQAYPHAKAKKIKAENEAGVISYEIKAIENGVAREITLAENGTIVSVEEEIKIKALPPAIRSALSSAYPKAKIEEAEKITQNGVVQYSVEFEVGETNTEVVLDEGGKIISTKDINEKEDDKGEGHKDEKGDDRD